MVETRRIRVLSVAGLLGLLLVVLPSAPVAAATTVGDGTPGSCNSYTLNVAVAAGGSITFNCGVAPLIIPVEEMTVTVDTTITGPVDAAGVPLITLVGYPNRHFVVTSGVSLTLERLVLDDGFTTGTHYGGSILNLGTLTVRDCAFTFNRSQGGNGGAIYSRGTLTVIDSTFIDSLSVYADHPDLSSDGGAIANDDGGTLTVSNSTFLNNTASGNGGAINNRGTLTVRNSTFVGNAAPGSNGGAISNIGTATVINSTIYNNSASYGSGGIQNWSEAGGTVTLANSIIAQNTGAFTWPNIYGAITSQGYNLIGDTLGWSYVGSPGTGDQIVADPLLAPLAANGGPTQTMLPQSGSPVIDAGNPAVPGSDTPACPARDQRGALRPFDGNADATARCDIGAVEAGADAIPPVTIVSPSPYANAAGWSHASVTLDFDATDNSSTVDHLVITLIGAQTDTRTTPGSHDEVTVNTPGITTLTFSAVDGSGIQEAPQHLTVKLDLTTPTVTQAPIDALVVGSRLDPTQARIQLHWSGQDELGGSGLRGFQVQQSINGTPFSNISLPSPVATTTARTVTIGVPTQYQVRVSDVAGNLSSYSQGPALTPGLVDGTTATVQYSSGWQLRSASWGLGGSVEAAGVGGKTASFTFSGSAVAWASMLGPDRGQASVTIDGGTPVTIDLYAASYQGRRLVWEAHGLDPTQPHTVVITVLGTKNGSSNGTRVDVDGFGLLR